MSPEAPIRYPGYINLNAFYSLGFPFHFLEYGDTFSAVLILSLRLFLIDFSVWAIVFLGLFYALGKVRKSDEVLENKQMKIVK